MTHFHIRIPTLAACCLLLLLLSHANADGRPNVLVILVDDLGYSDLGCYGGEVPTPHLDRLAAGGARFANCYNSARCCPSRAALMTGLYPHEAGIGSFANARPRKGWGPAYTGHLLPDTVTLAELLGDAGYSTWMVGKWHMGIPGPIARGFQNYFGYKNFLAHSENQWDPAKYVRLPAGTPPEKNYAPGQFYVTDVFTDYALEFLRQARRPSTPDQSHGARSTTTKPWFLYLAHSSPHFPIQAPGESIDRHVPTYRKGWDALRRERFARQKELGLISRDTKLPPLSEVPVDRDDIANGFSGQPNPAWASLPAKRREDLARRGATFAAMVGHVDQGIGRIIADLEKHDELDNTLILFTSDNGACYEWGPFGFDGRSRLGTTTLHDGEQLAGMGQADTHSSYGSGWANLGNTPLNMYKHFCHEGGIVSPLIAHWPAGLKRTPGFIPDPVHIMDIVPTVCEATGADYPESRAGQRTKALSGTSLLPTFRGTPLPDRTLAFEHQGARGLRRGDWKIVWGKRQPDEVRWELFNLKDDRTEQHDLAPQMPELTQQLVLAWETWAKQVGAEPFAGPDEKATPPKGTPSHSTPNIRNRPIKITCEVEASGQEGVIVAQGGREHGYALHLHRGMLTLDLRSGERFRRLQAPKVLTGRFKATARITAQHMQLTIDDDQPIAAMPSGGLIPVQPKDELSVGFDDRSAVGNYEAPNPFQGKIHQLKVTTGAPDQGRE